MNKIKIRNKEIFIISIPEGKPVKIIYERYLPCPIDINFYCPYSQGDPNDFLLTICSLKKCPSTVFVSFITH